MSHLDFQADRFAHGTQRLHQFAVAFTILLLILLIGVFTLYKLDVVPVSYALPVNVVCASLLTVTGAAWISGFLPQVVKLEEAGFALIAHPPIGQRSVSGWAERQILLVRQKGEPHRGEWILPGALRGDNDQNTWDTASRKVCEMAEVSEDKVTLARPALSRYWRRFPEGGIPYHGVVYEGALEGGPEATPVSQDIQWLTAAEIAASPDVPELVQEIIQRVTIESPDINGVKSVASHLQ